MSRNPRLDHLLSQSRMSLFVGPSTGKKLPPFARVMAQSAEMNRQLWEPKWGEATPECFLRFYDEMFRQMELCKFSTHKMRRVVSAI